MTNKNYSLLLQPLKRILRIVFLSALCWESTLLLNAKKASDADKLDGHDWSEVEAIAKKISVGDYKFSARTSNHEGWLLCNGGTVSRTTHAELFSVIGVQFGEGNKTTTFNLPNAKGRVAAAINNNRPMGRSEGSETHKLTVNEMPLHGHKAYYSRESGGGKDSDGYIAIDRSGPAEIHNARTGEPQKVTSSRSTNAIGGTGGNAAHNNMQPTLFVGNLFIYSGK